MRQLTVQDVHKLAERLAAIRHKTADDRDAVKAVYSAFDPGIDVRITSISRLLTVFDSTHLALMFIYKHLMNKSWWEANTTPAMPESHIVSYVNDFGIHSKMALIHFMFSSVENSFRLLLRALDPTACNNGTAAFKFLTYFVLCATLFTTMESTFTAQVKMRLLLGRAQYTSSSKGSLWISCRGVSV